MPPADLATALRPNQLPDIPAFWPPAPGWPALGLGLLLSLALLFWLGRLWRSTAPRRAALEELQRIEHSFLLDDDSAQLALELSLLLRRVMLGLDPSSAGLTGTAWLEALDARLPGAGFTQGVGRALVDAAFCPVSTALDHQELLALTRRWLRANILPMGFFLPTRPPRETPRSWLRRWRLPTGARS
ncbi:MAG: DUF4381 domain-containing protein [Magnetococcus sp. WYHC-3]